MAVSSYNSNTASLGKVKILRELTCDIGGRYAVIIEDIIDTGNALCAIPGHLISVFFRTSPQDLLKEVYRGYTEIHRERMECELIDT